MRIGENQAIEPGTKKDTRIVVSSVLIMGHLPRM